jgi:hypothetical protein
LRGGRGEEDEQVGRGQKENGEMIKYSDCKIQPSQLGPASHPISTPQLPNLLLVRLSSLSGLAKSKTIRTSCFSDSCFEPRENSCSSRNLSSPPTPSVSCPRPFSFQLHRQSPNEGDPHQGHWPAGLKKKHRQPRAVPASTTYILTCQSEAPATIHSLIHVKHRGYFWRIESYTIASLG